MIKIARRNTHLRDKRVEVSSKLISRGIVKQYQLHTKMLEIATKLEERSTTEMKI